MRTSFRRALVDVDEARIPRLVPVVRRAVAGLEEQTLDAVSHAGAVEGRAADTGFLSC